METIGKLICYCGTAIPITKEDLGFEEVECPTCENLNQCPETLAELEERNTQTLVELEERNAATHVRIMAKGEDGHVWCIKNMVPKTDLLEIILAGYGTVYPHATIWPEDEETTSAGYLASVMRDLD